MALKILLVDDHEIMRLGLRALLVTHSGWEICGEASDGREAVERAVQLEPDVVIMDHYMPNLNGVDATRQLLEKDPELKVIMFTDADSEAVIGEALKAGVRGYVLKSDSAGDLVAAIKALRRKRMFFTPRVNDLVLAGFLEEGQAISRSEAPKLPRLTARERVITQLLAEGNSSKAVAAQLSVSVRTIETHRKNIMRKLSLCTILDLFAYAIRNHLIQIDIPPRTSLQPLDSPQTGQS